MAVTYVDGDNSTSLNVTDITGLAWPVHAAEDLALFIGAIVDTATATIDSEFTTERSDIDGSLESILARRLPAVMTGSESGDITMSTGATANRMSAAVAIYRGAAAIATISYLNEAGAAATTHTCPAITISSSTSALVLLYAERVTSSATPITPSDRLHEADRVGHRRLRRHLGDDLRQAHREHCGELHSGQRHRHNRSQRCRDIPC